MGLLTIGQSPRVDVTNDLSKELKDVRFIEAGALDDFSYEEIVSSLRPEPGDTVYVTRLRDGKEVKISREKIIPLLQEKIKQLEKEAKIIAMLCSGEFPSFISKVPILFPEKLLKGLVASIVGHEDRLGVVIPLKEQIKYAENKWSEFSNHLKVISISPYSSDDEAFRTKARKLENVDYIILDCIGYSLHHSHIIKQVTDKCVISARSALLSALKGFL